MCGQSSAYNTYATLPVTNPLFPGFSRYANVNKDNFLQKENIHKPLETKCLQGFFYVWVYIELVFEMIAFEFQASDEIIMLQEKEIQWYCVVLVRFWFLLEENCGRIYQYRFAINSKKKRGYKGIC